MRIARRLMKGQDNLRCLYRTLKLAKVRRMTKLDGSGTVDTSRKIYLHLKSLVTSICGGWMECVIKG